MIQGDRVSYVRTCRSGVLVIRLFLVLLFYDIVCLGLCSFAEHYNPENTEFGVLRVLNDDLVKVCSHGSSNVTTYFTRWSMDYSR